MEEIETSKGKTSEQFVIGLVISILGFCGALISLLLSQFVVLMVFVVIHSVADLALMIQLIDANEQEGEKEVFSEAPVLGWLEEKKVLEQDRAAAISKRDELQEELKVKAADNSFLAEELKRTSDELEEVKSKLLAEEAAKAGALAEANDKLLTSILPPTEGQVEVLNIYEMAQKAVDELSAAAKKAQIDIVFNPMTEVFDVKADPNRIKILFRNIIDNSIKYMGKKGSLVITLSTIEDMIFIVLKDNGLGLPNNELSHIFELNYQGSNRISGNGLGLTQAKAIVDYYGGNIYAKSTENGGMAIYIQLPANQA